MVFRTSNTIITPDEKGVDFPNTKVEYALNRRKSCLEPTGGKIDLEAQIQSCATTPLDEMINKYLDGSVPLPTQSNLVYGEAQSVLSDLDELMDYFNTIEAIRDQYHLPKTKVLNDGTIVDFGVDDITQFLESKKKKYVEKFGGIKDEKKEDVPSNKSQTVPSDSGKDA